MGGTVKCSGAAKIKPPFEMGVDNFDIAEFGNLIESMRQCARRICGKSLSYMVKYLLNM